jgi:hypothetical protein
VDKHILKDPKHWRRRAEQMRSLAEQMDDAEARRRLLKVATGYEQLAKRAQERSGASTLKFEVVVVQSDIIVNLPGTSCSITYQRSSGPTVLVEKREWTRVDDNCPLTLEEFREASCQEALAKAKELGWMA